MNLVLIGYRCSGKTTVGKYLAGKLARDFIDTDVLIEEDAGSTIERIIAGEGWEHFRKIEKMVIEKVSREDNQVIATGGGVVLDEGNVKNLNRNGFIVWLKGKAGVLKERMEKEQRLGRIRPSLTGSDPLVEIDRVLTSRTPYYRKAANLTVDTGTVSIRSVATSILKALPESWVTFKG